ncbi:class I SAM-dependent methyltransferase [Streptomyces sp. NRRL S-813]|uniref:class I SAM-dependent methyltransferase n=1 Tax=Streptomyces sp. NRRL S-813 TaxID=1463919 RepID=UPI0004C1C628|nr:class I SAM-dependent methyltransferase [Streptomyces sp. NRRL S-813]
MADHDEYTARRAQRWDEVAGRYEEYFVPRFRPWVAATVEGIADTELPDGPILVPCCGTFPELPLLADRFAGREIVGIDISPGMISRAEQRAVPWPGARAVVQDAAVLDPAWSARCAAVVSVFGLQQLPAPDEAIANWVRALTPGGRLAVAFWPYETDATDPWGLVDLLLAGRTPGTDRSWEKSLAAAVTAAGGTIRRDEFVAFEMVHADAAALWDAMTAAAAGALHTTALRHGPKFVEQMRQEFLHRSPTGQWRHRRRARLIVADK